LKTENVVVVNDYEKQALFYAACLRVSAAHRDAFVCDREVRVGLNRALEKMSLAPEAFTQFTKEIDGKIVTSCRVAFCDDKVLYKGRARPGLIGRLSKEMAKKMLVDNKFVIEEDANGALLVNGEVRILFGEHETILLESANALENGKDDVLMLSIREVLYRKLVCL